MITTNNFDTEIDKTIVNRGYEYYLEGMVTSLVQLSKGRVKARVAGTEDYQVSITITKNEIVDWACSCPYDWGPVCKHVVAVLFALQADKQSPDSRISREQTKSGKRKSEMDQLSQILDNLSHDELKNFVQFYAEENSEFKLELLSEFPARISGERKDDYRQLVKNAYHSAMGRDGFIDYERTFKAVKPVQRLINNASKELKAGHLKKALEIAQAVLEESVVAMENSDDSSGNIGEIIEDSLSILFEIAEKCTNTKMRKNFFNWCLIEAQQQPYADFGWENNLFDLASLLIDDERQEQSLLELLDKLEEKTKDELWDYTREQYATIRLHLFQQRRSEKEAKRFLESNVHFSSFRQELIQQAIRKKDFATAKNLALDGIDHDTKRNYPGIVLQWKESLLQIAQLEKDTKTVRRRAFELCSTHSFDLQYYRIWKDTFQGQEQALQIERLIAAYKKKNTWEELCSIFIEEQRFKDLLEIVGKSPDIYTLEDYEKYLKVDFPQELVALYAQAVTLFVERNTGRRYYREACRILRKMKKLGGEETVSQLVARFKRKYTRRPALMEELSSL